MDYIFYYNYFLNKENKKIYIHIFEISWTPLSLNPALVILMNLTFFYNS